jgi:hypothetical protein
MMNHGGLTAVHHAEYLVWYTMKMRCTNPKYEKFAIYGARGIAVCDRWLGFANFIADMGPRPSRDHSIERRDNDGSYSPDNCYWATRLEQGRNKRNNHLLTHDGKTQSLNDWARELGIPRTRLAVRLGRGWTMSEAAVNRPWERQVKHRAKSKKR